MLFACLSTDSSQTNAQTPSNEAAAAEHRAHYTIERATATGAPFQAGRSGIRDNSGLRTVITVLNREADGANILIPCMIYCGTKRLLLYNCE